MSRNIHDHHRGRRQTTVSRLTNEDSSGIFRVKLVEGSKKGDEEYRLEFKEYKFVVPDKIYGNLKWYIDYYWDAFKYHKFKCGLIQTGKKGAGKTETSNVLCNRCIDWGLKVIELCNIDYTHALVEFLEVQDDVVFLFDEFSKNFPAAIQGRMLTLMNNSNDRVRITLVTENNRQTVSKYIISRPGRIRYGRHYGKVHISVVEDYISYYELLDKFKEDLLNLHSKVLDFTFDHLQAMVTEHVYRSDLDMKQILDILNLSDFDIKKTYKITDIKYNGDLELYKGYINPANVEQGYNQVNDQFLEYVNAKVWVTIPRSEVIKKDKEGNDLPFVYNRDNKTEKEVTITKDRIKFTSDEKVIFEVEDFEITFTIIEE